MNIALMSHDNKKELMVQFCTAYAGILSHHNIYATNTTGHMVADATGLNVHCFLSYAHGGSQQIGARIAYNDDCMTCFTCELRCPAEAINVHPFKEPLPRPLEIHCED